MKFKMKKVKIAFLASLLLLASGLNVNAQKAKKWNVDKSHASVNFSVNHFFSAVTGKFKDFSGDITFAPDDLEGSKVSFTFQTKSVDTDEDERDKHLQSEDFFAAEKFPTITFVSNKFVKKSDKLYEVVGKLTMRGTSKEIALPLTITGRMDNPWKKGYEILGISINTTLDRTDYGVGTGSLAATAIVGDEVRISISMELDAEK